MKTHFIKALMIAATVSILPGCLLPEDKGSVETVGTPVPGEADFDVNPAPPGNGGGTGPVAEEPPAPQPPTGSDFIFTIDYGAEYVGNDSVTMRFSTIYPLFREIKISSNKDCTGGIYEPLVSEKVVTNFNKNAKNDYSVLFRDVDGQRSQCLTASFIHDNLGPDILFTKYPMASVEEGQAGEIIFSVTDVSPITEVTCKLNSITRPCFAGTNTITISQMPAGDYDFSVTAKDTHGYGSTKSVQWTVVNRAKFLTHTVLIKDDRKVDVLIVIDNSGSMEYEQKNMADRVKNMLAILRGLDYRIAVTTTDPNATKSSGGQTYYGDGDLIPISGLNGQLWIDSTMDENLAQTNLGRTLQRPETGSGSEQGIRATYRFVEKATTAGNKYSSFFREGANFATLVISDEDESANTEKNDPEKLLQLIAAKFNSQKAYSFHSIITRPGDTACKSTYGAAYGERLKVITELTGGILGSVCEADYAQQVSGIATEIRNLTKNITLACAPLPEYPITVKRDGAVYAGVYTVEGVNMKFADILPAGEYKVDYACLK